MVEPALTAETPYPVAPEEIDTSSPDSFAPIFKGRFKFDLAVGANRFVQLAQRENNWGPFDIDQIKNGYAEVSLKYKFLDCLLNTGYVVSEDGFYRATVEFVSMVGQVAKSPLGSAGLNP